MPPKVADPENANLQFIFSVLKHCETIKPDWELVARENGISYGRNALAKFKTLVSKHEHKFEDNRIIALDPNATPPAAKPPKTPKTPKTPKSATATKRKAETNGDAGDPTPTKKKKPVEKFEPDVKDEEDLKVKAEPQVAT